MSDKDSISNAREFSRQQMEANMQMQAQHEKLRVKLETLREYIRTNGPSSGMLASEQINKAFDAITL